jgi:hypothetical protein
MKDKIPITRTEGWTVSDRTAEGNYIRGLVDEARDAIRKELIGKLAVATIAIFLGLLAAAAIGWWLFLKPKIIDVFGGVPTNGVIVLDASSGCASLGDSWEELANSQGRVIIGSDAIHTNGSTGGNSTVSIEEKNLPPLHFGLRKSHNSGNGLPYFDFVFAIDTRPISLNTPFANTANSEDRIIGGGIPLKVEPPSLALHFCKRK